MKGNKALTVEELYAISDEMGMMIEGGVSAVESISLMLQEAETEEDRKLLEDMQSVIYKTSSLSKAVQESGAFPEYFCQMVELGEQTGKTDDMFKSLSNHYARQISIKKAVKSAVGYPVLMILMMFTIIIVMVTKIMPIFEKVFYQLGCGMEGVSNGLLKVGKFLENNAIAFSVIVAVLVAFLIYGTYSTKGRKKIAKFGYRFKNIRSIMDKLAISSYASGLAIALSSGMDVGQALEVAANLVDNEKFKTKVEVCKKEFDKRMDLGKALFNSGIIGGIYGRMILLASKTGNVEQAMDKIADAYQQEADDQIHGIISVVEPTLVILMSLIVGMILLSVMLPLLSIMAGMR